MAFICFLVSHLKVFKNAFLKNTSFHYITSILKICSLINFVSWVIFRIFFTHECMLEAHESKYRCTQTCPCGSSHTHIHTNALRPGSISGCVQCLCFPLWPLYFHFPKCRAVLYAPPQGISKDQLFKEINKVEYCFSPSFCVSLSFSSDHWSLFI